ncbi:hypothetical protein ACFL6U_25070 [Planctomycetota bacterium]
MILKIRKHFGNTQVMLTFRGAAHGISNSGTHKTAHGLGAIDLERLGINGPFSKEA